MNFDERDINTKLPALVEAAATKAVNAAIVDATDMAHKAGATLIVQRLIVNVNLPLSMNSTVQCNALKEGEPPPPEPKKWWDA